jgi:hypothetical protein
MKEKIKNLIKLTFDDSRKVSGEATHELCKICNNIIKKYYDISKKYNGTYHEDVWEYYDPYCNEHRIYAFDGYGCGENKDTLEFLYTDVDGCDNLFYMPIVWFDDEYLNIYENHCKEFYIESLHDELKKYEMNIKKYTELKNKTLEKLKNVSKES